MSSPSSLTPPTYTQTSLKDVAVIKSDIFFFCLTIYSYQCWIVSVWNINNDDEVQLIRSSSSLYKFTIDQERHWLRLRWWWWWTCVAMQIRTRKGQRVRFPKYSVGQSLSSSSRDFSGLDMAHDVCLGLLFMEEPDWLVNLAYRQSPKDVVVREWEELWLWYGTNLYWPWRSMTRHRQQSSGSGYHKGSLTGSIYCRAL